jgi:hypothetical protein
MTIRDEEDYLETVWDWGFLKPCFAGTNIEPTDIDGFVERNGNFLYIETKKPGIKIPLGQRIVFRRFTKSGSAVLVIWGHRNKPEKALLLFGKDKYKHDPANEETIIRIVSRWFVWANKNHIEDWDSYNMDDWD